MQSLLARHWGSTRGLCCFVSVWVLFLGVSVEAAMPLYAAGDNHNLWILQPRPDHRGFTILHRNTHDKPDHLHPAASVLGRVVANGIACADGRLWLVYAGTKTHPSLAVQSIRSIAHPAMKQWRYDPPKFERALPRGVFVRSMAANRHGPWALVRVEDLTTLQQIDGTLTPPQNDTPVVQEKTGAPIATLADDGASLRALTVTPIATTQPTPYQQPIRAIHEDRLLRLGREGWVKVDLPQDWPRGVRGWVVMRQPDNRFPLLVAVTPTKDRLVVWVYEYQDGAWVRQHYVVHTLDDLPPSQDPQVAQGGRLDRRVVTALVMDRQLVVGLTGSQPQQISLDMFVLRSGSISPIGTLGIDTPPTRPRAVVPHNSSISLLTTKARGQWAWSQLNLQGQTAAPMVLSEHLANPWADSADYLVLVTVVVASMLTMFIFWRQEPVWNRLELSRGVGLADLGWRALAGGVDLLPALVVGMMIFKINPYTLMDHWPGHSGNWHAMLPGATTIAVFISYVSIAELCTATTPGKRMMGMRVATLTGSRPAPWQILARNLMKTFDLIAWPLLIMPLVGPYRQRLGDLAARTVVVVDARETDDKKPDTT